MSQEAKMIQPNLARSTNSASQPKGTARSRSQAAPDDLGVDAQPRIATWLTPSERTHVDAATNRHVALSHRSSFQRVVTDVLSGLADAALLSAALVTSPNVIELTKLVAGFPATPVIGLVLDADERASVTGPLLLGQAGVRVVIDARSPEGWAELRRALDSDNLPPRLVRSALAAISRELGGMSYGCRRFFSAIFAWRTPSARQLADLLGIRANTLGSRFFRASLPSPKRYLSTARLVLAAQLGENPALSLSAIAHRIEVSTPQSFSRHVRQLMDMSATEFRQRYSGETMMEYFLASLVRPYREVLRDFDPLLADLRRAGSVNRRSGSVADKGGMKDDVRAA